MVRCVVYTCECGYRAYDLIESAGDILCAVCGLKQRRYRIKYNPKEVKTEVVNITYKDNPRYSATLGVSETQIEEARKLHPQAEWKKFGHSYRPLIKNRTDKLRMMKQCGMEEFGVEQFKGRD